VTAIFIPRMRSELLRAPVALRPSLCAVLPVNGRTTNNNNSFLH
jgi:hypothetical protein